jgi:ABC-type polysaccharide/polyol phosphate export permease
MNQRTGLTGIVASLVFFAIGAVLHVAVTGVNYPQIGLIVMVVSGVGFVLSLGGWAFSGRPKDPQALPQQDIRP